MRWNYCPKIGGSISINHSENLIHAKNYQIFRAMARIASIAVLAMASDFMEDDEDEVEAVYELGWEV